MGKLLDTNVLSEVAQRRPNPRVLEWLASVDIGSTYLSVVTLAEISFGVEHMAGGARKDALRSWLDEDLPSAYRGRVLPMDAATARISGGIRAKALRSGRPMGLADAFLAGAAEVHGLILVTRNVKDFEVWGGPVFDPWSQTSP